MTPYDNTDLGQYWTRKWFASWRHKTNTWTFFDPVTFIHGNLTSDALTINRENELQHYLSKIQFNYFRAYDLNPFPRSGSCKELFCKKVDLKGRSRFVLVLSDPREGLLWLWRIYAWQNGRHFADDIFKCIFMNEKFCIFIRISLKFVPKGPIDNRPALVQIMA